MTVVSLNPTAELQEFFQFLWGDDEGYVYSPTKDPENGHWDTHFFNWPEERRELTNHIVTQTPHREVYIAPAMFSEPSAQKHAFKLSNVLWAEIDGEPLPPSAWDTVPHPSRRIQSSLDGHEHFYWRLKSPVTQEELEQHNRALAYFLNADSSGWDCNQVLRPPTTKNHKRDRVVTTVTTSASDFSLNNFATIPFPKQLVRDSIEEEEIPDLSAVIATYKWEPDDFEFFRKREIPQGSRSSALMRLGYICAEMRMSDAAAVAILLNADDRWGKFKNRNDRLRRLLDIVNKARLKYPIEPEVETPDELQIFGWKEFIELELHVDWIIKDILQRQGIAMLTGPPNVGKTQFTLQFCKHMALGRDWLGWNIEKPRKIVFFSLEMGPADLKHFMTQMSFDLGDDDKVLLQENFKVVPLGHSLLLDTPADEAKFRKYIEAEKPDGIVVDSLSTITENSSSEEQVAKKLMNLFSKIKQEYDLFVWFIHHNRKAQVNNKKPIKLDDVYGSQHFTRQATTVIGLWAIKGEIEVHCLKVRLSQSFDTFTVVRSEYGLNFIKTDSSVSIKTVTFGPAKKEKEESDGTSVSGPSPFRL